MGTLSKFTAPFDPKMAEKEGKKKAKKTGYQQAEAERLLSKARASADPSYYLALYKGYSGVGRQLQEASRARRKEYGQLDLSMLSPGMLSLVWGEQRAKRRRARRGGGFGAMGTLQTGRKTLLGE